MEHRKIDRLPNFTLIKHVMVHRKHNHYAMHIYVLQKLSMLVEMSVACKYKFNGAVRMYFKPKKVFLTYKQDSKIL